MNEVVPTDSERRPEEASDAQMRLAATMRASFARGFVAGAALLLIADWPSAFALPSATVSDAAASVEAPMCMAIQELVLYVKGLTCEGCAWQIRETLHKVDGITDIQTIVASKRVVVTFDPGQATAMTARQALDRLGYESEEVRQ